MELLQVEASKSKLKTSSPLFVGMHLNARWEIVRAEGDLERRNSAEDPSIAGRSFGDSSLLKAEGDLEQRSSTAGSTLSKVIDTGVADNFTEVVYHKDLLHNAEGDLLQQVDSVEFSRVPMAMPALCS